jgi:hypothetical protein
MPWTQNVALSQKGNKNTKQKQEEGKKKGFHTCPFNLPFSTPYSLWYAVDHL